MLAPVLLAALVMIESPAASGSAEPHLASLREGGVVMSWIEPTRDSHALKFAMHRNGKWSAPRVIAERRDFFVNWADFPSIVEDRRGTLFAQWLQKSGGDTYAYDVWITASRDYGKTWKAPRILHSDRKPGEHGFVSMVPLPKGGVAVAWLDSREMTPGGHHGHGGGAMTLRYAEVDSALAISRESLLDARVCECCTTGMTMTSRGPLVVYRDRSNEEIRDIAFVRKTGTTWTTPARVHADGWKIAGCPVNGPQVDANGDNVAVAWFTAAENKAEVNVAFSRDAGATFGKPLRIDGANAVGRVDVLMLDDASALVTWIEGTSDDSSIFTRRVYANGRMAAPQKLAATISARGAGFPRATLTGNTAWFAWTDLATKKIRVAKFE